MRNVYRFLLIMGLICLFSSCNQTASKAGCDKGDTVCISALTETASVDRVVDQLVVSTETPEPELIPKIWIAEDIQSSYRTYLSHLQHVKFTENTEQADVLIDWYDEKKDKAVNGAIVEWLYVPVVPFQSGTDSIELWTVRRAWQGLRYAQFNLQPLMVSAETAAYFTNLWGPANRHTVKIVPSDQILAEAQAVSGSWALIPFEELNPRWRILSVAGQFPLDRNLDREAYPFIARYFIQSKTAGVNLHPYLQTNYDTDQISSVLLTGTTAFVRHLAYQIETEGLSFPIEKTQQIFLDSDITHLSNEVPMFTACPSATPVRVEMRFCSAAEYIHIFNLLDITFVELSGNHELDWFAEPFLETLALYKINQIPYVGGGKDLQEAFQPLVLEDHGNRFVFFSCNAVGPESDLADETRPGSAPCDFERMSEEIAAYRADGYIPIVLLQQMEVDTITPHSNQRIDSALLAQAGAVIVSGSQAHRPQTYAFDGQSLIHYGLGNVFFDQTYQPYRYGIMDRHYFYQGEYISTEIIPIETMDNYQVQLMTEPYRDEFLAEILGEMK